MIEKPQVHARVHSPQHAIDLFLTDRHVFDVVWNPELGLKDASAAIVILSWMEASNEANTKVLNALSELVPNVPVVVLAQKNDVDLARTAIRHGAKGYIPCTLGFDITVEAVRFVLAGGTYVPMDCVLATGPGVQASPASRPSGGVTAREVAVIRALQQGKSNKVIAYELNMCESTVKVHVRNLMKKMKAKNRTDLAMKAQIAHTQPASRWRPCAAFDTA